MAVELWRPLRLRAGLGVVVHDGSHSYVERFHKLAGVVRMGPGVKEDELSCVGPDDLAAALHFGQALRFRIVRDDQFAAGRMIGAEEQASQRVGVNVALEAHAGAALDVQYYSVALVSRRADAFAADLGGEFEELVPVGLVQPGNMLADLMGVHTAPVDVPDLAAFA